MGKSGAAAKAAILAFALSSVSACRTTDLDLSAVRADQIRVCFYASQSGGTRTSIAANGVSTQWSIGDRTALWARQASGEEYVISGAEFSLTGKSGGKAEFSATLPSAMSEGRYIYSAFYPYPAEVSGNSLTFSLPAEQDGSAREAIMVSSPTEGGALADGKSPSESLCLQMEHICHILRLYLPAGEDPFGGEPIRSIQLVFSSPVVGQVHTCVPYSALETTLEEGSSTITLDLESALEEGGFACAAIHPTAFSAGGTLSITATTDSWEGTTLPISLGGRDFKAGHCTPVPILINEKKANYTIGFVLKENNIGEPLQRIAIGDEYEFSTGDDIPVGSVIKLRFDSEEEFRSQSGKQKVITFESEHVIATQTVLIPDLSSGGSIKMDIKAPWLLDENFDSVESFSSNDEYVTSSTGSKDAVSFLGGWTGGRIGAEAGKCIRIAGRRESGMWIDIHYPARVESACLPTIKSDVEIELTFDYGTNCDGINKYGQSVYVGYVTSTSAYKSGDTSGTYPKTFTSSAQDGSYDSTPNSAAYIMTIPASESVRISWRNDPESHSDFASNTTSWLYIDNVKVKIK